MELASAALERLAVAALVGFLIGLDRERSEARKHRRLFAGVRTFPLIALAGALPMLLQESVGVVLEVVAFVAVAAVTIVSYLRASAAGHLGATTEMAAIATFLLGVLAGAGQLLVAGAAGVAVAVLLVAKPRLERFSRALTPDELAATLELAVITVIVLPLVPNKGYGPWNALNPFQIWLVVVLVSGLSFAGFVAVRLLGERRGILLAGAVGALVSSTAVTVSMARQSRTAPRTEGLAAAATVLASVIMSVRVGILVTTIQPGLLRYVAAGLAGMTVVSAVSTWLLARRSAGHEASSRSSGAMKNPFSLMAAITFAAIFAVITLMARAADAFLGPRGVYVAAVLGSLVDVDAIAIAFAQSASSATLPTLSAGIVLAMSTNSLVKLGIAVVMGRGAFRWRVAAALGSTAVVGGVAALAIARS